MLGETQQFVVHCCTQLFACVSSAAQVPGRGAGVRGLDQYIWVEVSR